MTQERYIKIKQTAFGRSGGYGDERYAYEIESNISESALKRFCVEILQPCSQSNDLWYENEHKLNSNPAIHFAGYYCFTKRDNEHYEYSVYRPMCD